ncbi:MAG: response regulator [Nitrospina sp.]|jgi:signal transduction histidine kinase|nr:response regulator [Nitrospina sp.]MBT6718655.1 response regulator [Nitrospina sp.]
MTNSKNSPEFSPEKPSPLPTGKKKILVVDDDSLVLSILSSLLSENHYQVETAEDGKQALKLLDDSFDLLLSDLEMPEMNGLQLLERLRKSGNNIPVVILTGNQEISVALNALKVGANDYVIKDENITETVLTAIANSLERKMLLDQNSRLIENLMKAKENAEKANKAKSDFLAKMSHDLKTPLNAILGYTELMIVDPDEPLDDGSIDNLNQIFQAGNHLLELINDILDLSAIEAGKLKVVIEKIDVISIIQESLVLIRPSASKNSIKIIDETQDLNSIIVLADSLRLKQILLNLLSNGIKYNIIQGTLTVSLIASGDKATVNIQDTGPGIPEDKIETLFEKFNRLGAEKTNIEGTGIGLNICRNLVDLMSGSLNVESELGKGSCFSITIPLSPKNSNDKDSTSAPGKERFEILFINPQSDDLAKLRNMFIPRPFIKLSIAENGPLGISQAEKNNPKLIIMGCQSELDPNLLQTLKENTHTKNIPVVLLTEKDLSNETDSTQYFACLTYPINPILLLATIESALEI